MDDDAVPIRTYRDATGRLWFLGVGELLGFRPASRAELVLELEVQEFRRFLEGVSPGDFCA